MIGGAPARAGHLLAASRRFLVGSLAPAAVLLALLVPADLAGQGADEEELRAMARTPVVRTDRRSGELEIDGRLREAAWESAPVATGFVQAEPVEGAPAEQDTDVRILFDEDAIYVAARMHDSEPRRIAHQLVRRDQEGQYDYFEVAFDPNLDQRTGYLFRVSAAGVQRDEFLYDDNQSDHAWDAVWASEVARDSLGWTAELRIPLSQIRYEASDSAGAWGINFRRRRLASNEITHFSLISRLQDGVVSQFGLLEGVRIGNASRRLEFLPYGVSRVHTGPAEEGDPFFDGREADARVGADVKYGLGGSFTLDGTVNPDFGQVEADPAVIDLSAFETFFQERRPFFVEDARIFDFTLSGRQNRLFHSRRIGREPHGRAPPEADHAEVPDNTTILGAAKLSGRTSGGLSVGALAAATGAERGRAFFSEDGTVRKFLVEPRADYGVFRLRQDFAGGASQVGGIVTGMRRGLPDDGAFDHLTREAYSGGVDFELQWDDREWAFFGFLTGSHVRGDSTAIVRLQRSSNHYFQRPDARWVEMDSSATSMTGAEWRLELERRRGDWTGAVWAGQATPGFAINDLGFSRNQEKLDGGARIGYREIDPGERLRSWNLTLFTFHNWSHDVLARGPGSLAHWRDAHTSGFFNFRGRAEFLNYWQLNGNVGYSPRSMSRTATRGGPVMLDPASVRGGLRLQTDRRRSVSVEPNLNLDRNVGEDGSGLDLGLGMRFRPSGRLSVQVNPSISWRTEPAQYVATTDALPYERTYGRRYLFGELERRELSMETRVDWAFNPNLTLQVFAQPLLSAGDYVRYRQLREPGTYRFDDFTEGEVARTGDAVRCVGGRTCEGDGHLRHVDFDGDGSADFSFPDRDFNVRSLIGNAVLRWEYRPGSRIFLVWQRHQARRSPIGDFAIGRDASSLARIPADDVFMIKVDYWLGL